MGRAKGGWPRDIKNGDKWEGRRKKGVFCRHVGDYKREGKREMRKRERVKFHGRKKGGYKRVFLGGKEASIAMISKSGILVISALGWLIDINSKF